MSLDKLLAEQEAFECLTRLIQDAQECQMLFENAGMGLPEPLARFLDVSPNGSQGASPTGIPAPPSPRKPSTAGDDWMWLPVNNALAQTVALAVMRRHSAPMRPKEVGNEVSQIMTDVSVGSVYNLIGRLKDSAIREAEKGRWQLIDPSTAPILGEKEIWASKEILSSHELAAHRRLGILHLLRFFKTGLEAVQIVEQLRECPWMKAPVSKDLLKADVQILQKPEGMEGRKIRRRGNTKKWEVVRVGKDGE